MMTSNPIGGQPGLDLRRGILNLFKLLAACWLIAFSATAPAIDTDDDDNDDGPGTPPVRTISITPVSGNTTEPWNKLRDPNHNKANLGFMVVVANANGPVEITITSSVIDGTGGHVHTAGRHKGKLVETPTGALVAPSSSGGSETLSKKKTDNVGVYWFTFGAEEASGEHTLTASCVNPTCNGTATATVKVKVDGLAPIPSSLYYRFITPNADTYHPNNHNLKPEASAQLAAIAKAYYEATYLLKDGWIPNVMLNDASLEQGGILDCFHTCIKGNSVPWGPDHREHRRGSVVDIRARLPAVLYPSNPLGNTLLYEDDFIQAARDVGADPHIESSGNGRHIHLRIFGIPE